MTFMQTYPMGEEEERKEGRKEHGQAMLTKLK